MAIYIFFHHDTKLLLIYTVILTYVCSMSIPDNKNKNKVIKG